MKTPEKAEPVEEQYIEKMRAIISVVDEFVNEKGKPKTTGIALLMFPLGTHDGRMNYLSNAVRKDMICAMKELLARLEGRVVDSDEEH